VKPHRYKDFHVTKQSATNVIGYSLEAKTGLGIDEFKAKIDAGPVKSRVVYRT
jgi:hypothetical protein